jgi:hypothetical protein
MDDLVTRLRDLVNDDDTEMLAWDAADRIEELEAALGKYGWHESKCDHFSGHNCSCGWDDARAALGEKTND